MKGATASLKNCVRIIWTKYQWSVVFRKPALLELSSWRCCLLLTKSYIDFE